MTRKAATEMSTRRRSSVRCSTSVMASGAGLSVRRFSEMATVNAPRWRSYVTRRSIHRGVARHAAGVTPDGVDGALGVTDRHPGYGGGLVGLDRPVRAVGAPRCHDAVAHRVRWSFTGWGRRRRLVVGGVGVGQGVEEGERRAHGLG